MTFRQHGMECRWIVECKLWQGRIGKQEILTLKGVVEDIGADRGIIFCETGFQTGARDAARHSNLVLVTSLDEFRRTAEVSGHRINLVWREGSQPGTPPVYTFPGGGQPQRLLAYGERVSTPNEPRSASDALGGTIGSTQRSARMENLTALKRREGIVWIPSYGVLFPMRTVKNASAVVCIQTLAGFRKILGLANCSQDRMRVVFHDNREDFEALASLLYQADPGEAMTITVNPAPDTIQAGDGD